MTVFFQQQVAADGPGKRLLQPCFHCRDSDQFGFDNPTGDGGFRECLRQIWRKALKAGTGVLDIVGRQANVR